MKVIIKIIQIQGCTRRAWNTGAGQESLCRCHSRGHRYVRVLGETITIWTRCLHVSWRGRFGHFSGFRHLVALAHYMPIAQEARWWGFVSSGMP